MEIRKCIHNSFIELMTIIIVFMQKTILRKIIMIIIKITYI